MMSRCLLTVTSALRSVRKLAYSLAILLFFFGIVLYYARFVASTTFAAAVTVQPGVAAVSATDEALVLAPDRFLQVTDNTQAVAWGDIDNDGDLDLATGNDGSPLVLYENRDGLIHEQPIWQSPAADHTNSIAWGDMDGDGYLDLAVGNTGQPIKVYRNTTYQQNGTILQIESGWQSTENYSALAVAWGDVNADGRLDLAVGLSSGRVQIYLNQGTTLNSVASWAADVGASVRSVAWGNADTDGDLDLAVGTYQHNKIFFFDPTTSAITEQAAPWSSPDSVKTEVVAWGDMDGDGCLDLAVGNSNKSNQVYLNNCQHAFSLSSWAPANQQDNTSSLAWGDVDGDGALDLVVGNMRVAGSAGQPIRIYRNVDGLLQATAAWESIANDAIRAIALGDMDGDGDLDLAAGAFGSDTIYRNRSNLVQSVIRNFSEINDTTNSVAWGDVDNDGDLDLAVGNVVSTGGTAPDYLYKNVNGQLLLAQRLPEISRTRSVAWGDVDGDGDLDLAMGNGALAGSTGAANMVFYNDGDTLAETPGWRSTDQDDSTAIAWGDVDGDGDLDLAVGNSAQSNKLYINTAGVLTETATWSSTEQDKTESIAWGDMDGDGDLDLAVGNSGVPSKVYLNESGALTRKAVWQTADTSDARSVAWGDMNGDGLLDLAIGCDGQPTRVYLNDHGRLQTVAGWYATDNFNARSVAWGDVDGDGDLDLAIGNDSEPNKIYLNDRGMLSAVADWQSPTSVHTRSVAWGDLDGDGDLDLAVGNGGNVDSAILQNVLYINQRATATGVNDPTTIPPTMTINLQGDPTATFRQLTTTALAPANFYALAAIRQGEVISLTYTLYHPTSAPIGRIRVYYSLDGSFSGPRSTWHLAQPAVGTPMTNLATAPYPTQAENRHVFAWNVGDSDFFGQSDNVVVRIEALPDFTPSPNSAPGPFQWPYVAAQTFPFRVRGTQVRVVDLNNKPLPGALVYRIAGGRLSGGAIGAAETVFHTDSQGYLAGRGALAAGDELIALWPVTTTAQYTLYQTSAQPTPDLTRAPNGLTTYHVQHGGVQTLVVSPDNPLLLFTLTVALQWDAGNDPGFVSLLTQNLAKTSAALYDWTNGQVALGRVTVYQAKEQWDEADVRIYASNEVRPVANRGGVVRQPTIIPLPAPHEAITATRGEIRIGAVWNRYGDATPTGDDWPNVLAHELGHYLLFLEDTYLGLDETGELLTPITTCTGTAMTDPYDDINSELRYDRAAWDRDCAKTLAELPEWNLMQLAYPPLKIPQLFNSGPAFMPFTFTAVMVKPAPTMAQPLLVDDNIALTGNEATFAGGRAYLRTPGQRIIDLGGPVLSSLTARGARVGDEVCLFATQKFACTTLNNSVSPQLTPLTAWHPTINLTPINTTTFSLQVSGAEVTAPHATVYPNGEQPQTVTLTPGVAKTIVLNHPAVEVWIDIAGDRPEQRVITEYAVGSGPGRLRSHDGPGRLRSHDGPFTSGDGHVTLYPPKNLTPDTFIALQTATSLPALPPGLTPLGRSYYVQPSQTVSDFSGGSLAFQYAGLDLLLAGLPEDGLTIYYWNGSIWRPLTTERNLAQNFASAPLVGAGLYVLTSTYYEGLSGPGWNDIAYPASFAAQPVADALKSLGDAFSIVYECDAQDNNDPWKLFAPETPAWLNDLQQVKPQHVYKIYVTKSITWTVGPPSVAAAAVPCAPQPPSTFYGELDGTVAAGTLVTAQINGERCGEGLVRTVNGQQVFSVAVAADNLDGVAHCGRLGQSVTFALNGYATTLHGTWDNSKVVALTVDGASPTPTPDKPRNALFLPLVVNQ